MATNVYHIVRYAAILSARVLYSTRSTPASTRCDCHCFNQWLWFFDFARISAVLTLSIITC